MNKQIAKDKFLAMKQMMEKYGLQTAGISSYIDGIDSFHVTSPLVGRFSTGKSALLNSLLGKKYLSEDTQPETAIPTEIIDGDIEKVTLVKKDPDTQNVVLEKHISMEDFSETFEKNLGNCISELEKIKNNYHNGGSI